jgi:hypothetical protein
MLGGRPRREVRGGFLPLSPRACDGARRGGWSSGSVSVSGETSRSGLAGEGGRRVPGGSWRRFQGVEEPDRG